MGAFSFIPDHIEVTYEKTLESGIHLFAVRNKKSTGKYQVSVEVGTNHVVDCTCPHRKYRNQYCKHMKYLSEVVANHPRLLTKVTSSRILPSLSNNDNKLVNDIVYNYQSRIKTDAKLHKYVKSCVEIWSKHQTQIYIEDVKYRFDDSFSASEVLAHRLKLEELNCTNSAHNMIQ